MDHQGAHCIRQWPQEPSGLVQIQSPPQICDRTPSRFLATVISMMENHHWHYADSKTPPPEQRLLHLRPQQEARQFVASTLKPLFPRLFLEASFVLLPGQMQKGLLIMNRVLSALLNTEALSRCATLQKRSVQLMRPLGARSCSLPLVPPNGIIMLM